MMKRGILCFVLAVFIALPAVAAAEVHGVYIAPKFLLGIQDTGPLKRNGVSSDEVKQYSQAVFGGALAVGYNFAPKFDFPVRTEIEFALRSGASNTQDGTWTEGMGVTGRFEGKQTTHLSTLFFNAYFDIDTGTPFTPYLGGGLGMAFNNTEVKFSGDSGSGESWNASKSSYKTTFAWNLGAGLAYAFTENISADLGYRFVWTGYNEVKGHWGDGGEKWKVGGSPYIHEFYLGARFTF